MSECWWISWRIWLGKSRIQIINPNEKRIQLWNMPDPSVIKARFIQYMERLGLCWPSLSSSIFELRYRHLFQGRFKKFFCGLRVNHSHHIIFCIFFAKKINTSIPQYFFINWTKSRRWREAYILDPDSCICRDFILLGYCSPKNEQKKTLRMIVVVFGDPIASFRKVPPCGTNEHTTFWKILQ